MGKYEEDAEGILEGRGIHPERPLVLQLLGQAVNDAFDKFYHKIDGATIVQSQKVAVEKTFAHMQVVHTDEWRVDYERDGYVKLYSPLLEDMLYICRDDNMFKFLARGGDACTEIDTGLVVYTQRELKHLKTLSSEDVKWIHLGKTFKGQLVK